MQKSRIFAKKLDTLQKSRYFIEEAISTAMNHSKKFMKG